ncbi:hypothetical protein [Flavobacterium sp.]|uniref:hypothetical protein n=1 Tax=Flavobacterium sp. TaxID=239 RepID=UPI0037525950
MHRPRNKVTLPTIEILKELDVVVRTKRDKAVYKITFANKGYDILENLLVVRQYYRKHLKVDLQLLELLLALYPKTYFTQDDYFYIPKQLMYSRLKKLMDLKYVVLFSKAETQKTSVFTLSLKGRQLIENFYKLLSGEKKIPTDEKLNPMANKKDASAMDIKRLNFIKSVNKLPVSESKKALFS